MEVLLKIGRYAGELKDVRADIAAQMIEDGRAEDPRLAEISLPAGAPSFGGVDLSMTTDFSTSVVVRGRRR
jgi:hypothetical protein